MEKVVVNMNVNGSLSSPIIYEIKPPDDEIWHITRTLISITDQTVMDDSKFGGIAALANGVVLRENKTINDTITIWKSNQTMIEDMFNVVYSDKAPAGYYGLRGEYYFGDIAVALKLDGSIGDKLEILIQDDLRNLDTFKIKAQAHKEG